MKKLIAIAFISLCFAACSETTSKEETTTTGTDVNATETTVPTEAQRREKEISDSTKMLDKQLADPNSKTSPDSLK